MTLWTVTHQTPLSVAFSRQEYWSGLSFPSLGDLPDLGIKPGLPHCGQTLYPLGFPGGSDGKRLPIMQETQVRSLGQEDPLEKEMTTHSSILAWIIPWTEEPDGLQSMGSHKSQIQHGD